MEEDDASREAFEKWAVPVLEIHKSGETYEDSETRAQWRAWQAALRSRDQEIEELVGALKFARQYIVARNGETFSKIDEAISHHAAASGEKEGEHEN